jgi:hypothetical protein
MDMTVLQSVIEGDGRYATALQDGANGELTTLLNEVDTGAARRWRSCSVSDLMDALATETLTAGAEARLQTYAAAGGAVPTHRPGVKAWFEAQFPTGGGSWSTATEAAVRNLVEKDSPYCVSALDDSEDKVTLRQVREVVRLIPGGWNSQAASEARVADKAGRVATEQARRARIVAEVDTEGLAGLRPEVMTNIKDADQRINAEITLRVRAERIFEGLA